MLHSKIYHLLPVDLRLPQTLWNLLSSSPPNSDNPRPLLSPSLPTLLLFECVLVYMSPASSSALIQSFVDYFSGSPSGPAKEGKGVLGGIVYEMFGLEDAFGRVMLNNLQVPRRPSYFNASRNDIDIIQRHVMSYFQVPNRIPPYLLSPTVSSITNLRMRTR
jgi:hypothetical protein